MCLQDCWTELRFWVNLRSGCKSEHSCTVAMETRFKVCFNRSSYHIRLSSRICPSYPIRLYPRTPLSHHSVRSHVLLRTTTSWYVFSVNLPASLLWPPALKCTRACSVTDALKPRARVQKHGSNQISCDDVCVLSLTE